MPPPGAGPYIDEALIADLEAQDTACRMDKPFAPVRELNAHHAGRHPRARRMLLRSVPHTVGFAR
ncbi:hypothetical protein AB0L74_19375 [Streptomyces sp. NPDC052020]|uniref:hypothetical protein n=1 Tax=Streptomyces sp. NPDC052020 TaxID=3155677 RepID=UPI0034154F5C